MRVRAFRGLGSSSRTSPTGRPRMSRTLFSLTPRYSSCPIPRLAAMLARGGAFAAQMPMTARESSHALMRMVAAEGPWSSRLVPIAKTQPLIADFEDYYEWLRPVASRIDIWMTTYVHAFDGPEGIADWFAGSALQPFLERLSDDERCAFLDRYRAGLRSAYPAQSDGRVLFTYPRLFIIASRA
jgi:trans-aconitate 2-methyltransferase